MSGLRIVSQHLDRCHLLSALLVFGLLAPTSTFAGTIQSFTINITVKERGGERRNIQGANVCAYHPAGIFKTSAVTGANGQARLVLQGPLSTGIQYSIKVSKPGYRGYSHSAQPRGSAARRTAQLQRGSGGAVCEIQNEQQNRARRRADLRLFFQTRSPVYLGANSDRWTVKMRRGRRGRGENPTARVNWSSSNPQIVRIDQQSGANNMFATVTSLGPPGRARITASMRGARSISQDVEVRVNPRNNQTARNNQTPQAQLELHFVNPNTRMEGGASQTLTVRQRRGPRGRSVNPTSRVTWTSSRALPIERVLDNGRQAIIRAPRAGGAGTVTASMQGAKRAQVRISYRTPPRAPRPDPTRLMFTTRSPVYLNATTSNWTVMLRQNGRYVSPTSRVNWQSSHPRIVRIDRVGGTNSMNARISSLGVAGRATITARMQGVSPVSQPVEVRLHSVQRAPTPRGPRFSDALYRTFRSASCTNCHGFANNNTTYQQHVQSNRITRQTNVTSPASCQACHGQVPNWRAAPRDQGFAGKSARQICEKIKEHPRFGNAAGMRHHLTEDPLINHVLGNRRGQFHAAARAWIDGGMRCN